MARHGENASVAFEMVGPPPGEYFLNRDCIVQGSSEKEFIFGKVK